MYSRNYRRKRRNKFIFTLIFIIIAFSTCAFAAIKTYDFFTNSKSSDANAQSQEIAKNTQYDLQDSKDKKQDLKKEYNLDEVGADDFKKEETQVQENKQLEKTAPSADPTAYKKGTSHNNEASAWAYKTKDVNQWILKPSSYTGQDKLVFLTFDDGPSGKYTNTVLDILKEKDVHATFFIVGKNADQDYAKPIIQRQLKEGNAVGMHSYTHNYSILYPHRVANLANIKDEIAKTQKALQSCLGPDFNSTVLRFPGGHMSWKSMKPVDDNLALDGIYNVDWNVLTGDAVGKNDPKFHMGALQSVQQDMQMYANPKVVVILMHDIHAKSVNELGQIIDYYKGLGYKFGILE